jgi:hypothetical protein
MFARQGRRFTRVLNESSTVTLGGLIFALAYLTRVGFVFVLRYYQTDLDLESEILHIAIQFARNFSFANPYLCPTGATAHAPPGFPMLLGVIFRLFQPGVVRQVVLCLIGSAVSAAAYAFLPWFALNLGFQRMVGVIAGVLGALLPLFFWIEARGIWDAPYTALFLILGVGVCAALNPAQPVSRFVWAGAIWGVGFWFAPSLLPVFVVCAAGVFWRCRPALRALAATAAFCVSALVLVSPWIVRNYIQFHSVFWMRDNFGLELHTSNNPEARPIEADNRENTHSFRVHPNGQLAACVVVQRMGEVAYFKEQQREAMAWIRSDPGAFLRLSAIRAWYFWFVPLASPVKKAASAVLTAMCFGGLLLGWRVSGARLLLAVLLIYSAIYCFIQMDPRFRYPIHPLILVGAAWLVHHWVTRSIRTGSLERTTASN